MTETLSTTPRNVPSVNAPLWRNALFVAPYLFFFVTLLVVPLFWGIWLSLHKADAFSIGRFVGLTNYIRLFNDRIFIQSIWNTFYFVVLTVPALAIIGLLLALALNRQTRTAAVLARCSSPPRFCRSRSSRSSGALFSFRISACYRRSTAGSAQLPPRSCPIQIW